MADVRFTCEALADLDDIATDGVERFGAQAALRYLTALQDAIESLRAFPRLGAVYPGYDDVRYLSRGSH